MEYRNPKDLTSHPVSIQLYGENQLDDILGSIQEFGILTPLTITSENKIISGHRRWRCALTLELKTIPVEVKTYDDDLAEKRAILEFNRQREKTFSQKMNEAKLLKEVIAEQAKRNSDQSQSLNRNINGTFQPTTLAINRQCGRTADIVGQQVGIGKRDTFERAEKIWDKAQSGDIKAKILVKELDTGEKTISGAFNELIDKPHISFNTGENEWYTPKEYIDLARQVLGEIDLDPASAEQANQVIKAITFFTKEQDGLKQKWEGRIWLNPPYAQPLVAHFCKKLILEYRNQNVTEAIVLVNNATETEWFQTIAKISTAICFPSGRIHFWNDNNTTSGPLQGQAIIYIGNKLKLFSDTFKTKGLILGHLQ